MKDNLWLKSAIADGPRFWEKIVQLIQIAQKTLEVVPDGLPGPKTLAALQAYLLDQEK